MENEKNGANHEVVSSKTPRRTFSVSKEFESILQEIDTMPNMSRFVCESIKEKLERVKNPGKDIADALANFVQIQSIISQPIQNIQPLNQTEGQVIPPSPSVPVSSTYVSNRPLDESEIGNSQSIIQVNIEEKQSDPIEPAEQQPSEIVEKHTKPEQIEGHEAENNLLTEAKHIDTEKQEESQETKQEVKDEEIEALKKKAMQSYFGKG